MFVKVSVVARPTKVSAVVGKVKVLALLTIVDITGAVKVLFVKVSVVARPTKVSFPLGIDIVPLLLILVIIGVDFVS